jgi:tRNA-Thr(GGU) m(6)t(6)A37 methyltransferase TsaA
LTIVAISREIGTGLIGFSDVGPDLVLRPIGWVESPIADPSVAARQGDEGAPDCWLRFDPEVRAALDGLRPGDDIVVLTWLHLADRSVLQVHPRGDASRPKRGVFATRSQHRPNPIGVHTVTILDVDGTRVRVQELEAVDRTPIIDVKSALEPRGQR